MKPAEIIGEAAVLRLRLAGWEIVPRPAPERTTHRWTCPHCGSVHAPRLGNRSDVYADYGRVWHRPCVPFGEASWRPGPDRQPMTPEMVRVPL